MDGPGHLAWVRRATVGVLGVVLLIDALIASPFPILQFVCALILLGLIPIDLLVDLAMRPAHDEGEIDRLREVMERKEPPTEAGGSDVSQD